LPRARHSFPTRRSSDLAAANVPGSDTGRFSAYLTETAFAPEAGRPEALGAQVVAGLVTGGVVEDDQGIASIHTIDVDYAYPVPTDRKSTRLNSSHVSIS